MNEGRKGLDWLRRTRPHERSEFGAQEASSGPKRFSGRGKGVRAARHPHPAPRGPPSRSCWNPPHCRPRLQHPWGPSDLLVLKAKAGNKGYQSWASATALCPVRGLKSYSLKTVPGDKS